MAVQISAPVVQSTQETANAPQNTPSGTDPSAKNNSGGKGSAEGRKTSCGFEKELNKYFGTRKAALSKLQMATAQLFGAAAETLPTDAAIRGDAEYADRINRFNQLHAQLSLLPEELAEADIETMLADMRAPTEKCRFDPDLVLGLSEDAAAEDEHSEAADGESVLCAAEVPTDDTPVTDVLPTAVGTVAVDDEPAPADLAADFEEPQMMAGVSDAKNGGPEKPATATPLDDADRPAGTEQAAARTPGEADVSSQGRAAQNVPPEAMETLLVPDAPEEDTVAFRETDKKEERPGETVDGKQNEGPKTPKKSFASGVPRAGKTMPAAQIERHGDAETHGPNAFQAEMASGRRQAGEAAPASSPNPSGATSPGTTYVLSGPHALEGGITSIVEFMRNDGVQEALIVVDPPMLGRIEVSLQAGSAGVEAIFRVDNEDLRQMMQQQMDLLKSSLQAQGIYVAGLTVDIRNKDDHKSRGDAYDTGKKTRRTGASGSVEDETEGHREKLVRLDLEKGLLHWVA